MLSRHFVCFCFFILFLFLFFAILYFSRLLSFIVLELVGFRLNYICVHSSHVQFSSIVDILQITNSWATQIDKTKKSCHNRKAMSNRNQQKKTPNELKDRVRARLFIFCSNAQWTQFKLVFFFPNRPLFWALNFQNHWLSVCRRLCLSSRCGSILFCFGFGIFDHRGDTVSFSRNFIQLHSHSRIRNWII